MQGTGLLRLEGGVRQTAMVPGRCTREGVRKKKTMTGKDVECHVAVRDDDTALKLAGLVA